MAPIDVALRWCPDRNCLQIEVQDGDRVLTGAGVYRQGKRVDWAEVERLVWAFQRRRDYLTGVADA